MDMYIYILCIYIYIYDIHLHTYNIYTNIVIFDTGRELRAGEWNDQHTPSSHTCTTLHAYGPLPPPTAFPYMYL